MKPLPSDESMGDFTVVDDDLFSLRVLTDLLAKHGYRVRSA
jgi:hypothetical protein